jgi:threonyl-tRNA synthetase
MQVTLPDGSKRTLPDGATFYDLAKDIGPGLAKVVVAAKLDGELMDIQAPIPREGVVQLLKADAPESEDIIRHSCEHVLATAVLRLFQGAQVTMGPSDHSKDFYYDFDIGRPFSPDDIAKIEEEMAKVIKEDVKFTRKEVSKAEAAEMFAKAGQRFKPEILAWIPGETVTVYEDADFVDLCRGPHIPSAGKIGAFKLLGAAGSYWRGDATKDPLQRIRGVAFKDEKTLKKYFEQLEQAKARDHRKLGKELGLFAFSPLAPASPFFLPKGAHIYNKMIEYVRSQYRRYGYQEVITPQIYSAEVFKTSGHYDNYSDNMYFATAGRPSAGAPSGGGESASPSVGSAAEDVSVLIKAGLDRVMATASEARSEPASVGAAGGLAPPVTAQGRAQEWSVKPMNCPGHCVLFGMTLHSFRELPWRCADFGRLHRAEGEAVHGMMRVRTFVQDDAHIFCTPEQIAEESASFIDLVDEVYEDFGFTKDKIDVKVATRPEKRMGSEEIWDRSEKALADALASKGRTFEFSPGEGAFYGPKIEFHVKDALDRSWQLGTLQVDFNLPERFQLDYVGADGARHRPVMLHRAILGSLERFFGVYLEHTAGAYPSWLAPVQAIVLPVTDRAMEHGEKIARALFDAGVRVEVDRRNEKLGKKIAEAQTMKVPFMLVVGDREVEQGGASVRLYGGGDKGYLALDQLVPMIVQAAELPGARRSQRRE